MSTNAIHRIADNLVNGNLTDAKKQAKRVSFAELQLGFRAFGWGEVHAAAAALYLKHPSPTTWQRYCDASVAA